MDAKPAKRCRSREYKKRAFTQPTKIEPSISSSVSEPVQAPIQLQSILKRKNKKSRTKSRTRFSRKLERVQYIPSRKMEREANKIRRKPKASSSPTKKDKKT